MTNNKVEKYRKPISILHWVHAFSFVILFLTGLVFFIPALGFLAEDGWTRLIHRIMSVIFVAAPVIYTILDPKSVGRGIKKAFTWGKADIGWLKAAPGYYFLGNESKMPPQDSMNTGQKMWWCTVIIFGVIFVIAGGILWFAKETASPALLQWMILVLDISFIITGAMFLLHFYLAVLHPKMTESWDAMASGKISVEYAKKHHGKWYSEITKGEGKGS